MTQEEAAEKLRHMIALEVFTAEQREAIAAMESERDERELARLKIEGE